MANICFFATKVVGKKENVQKFFDAMKQENNVYMGRGAEIDEPSITENYKNNASLISAETTGECKWSVYSALIDSAVSMRTEPETWDINKKITSGKIKVLTLLEASRRYDVNVEIFSEESGMCFAEHYIVEKGKFTVDESCDYIEYYLDDYESKEEAEKELGRKITEDEWKEGWCHTGGYDWQFSDLLKGFNVA